MLNGADPVDPARREMEVGDRIALVGAANRLVRALTEQGQHTRMSGHEIAELSENGIRDAGFRGEVFPESGIRLHVGGEVFLVHQ